jgi:hypothetical protein
MIDIEARIKNKIRGYNKIEFKDNGDIDIKHIFTNAELGINENDYIDEHGHYKDYNGNEYRRDRDYLSFKKIYDMMKPTREHFYILRSCYNTHSFHKKDYDYSFVKSPSLRYFLFDEKLPESDKDDKYFSLLDIEIRKIMKDLIALLNKTEDQKLKKGIIKKINKIKETDYIFTKKENDETFMPLFLYEHDMI